MKPEQYTYFKAVVSHPVDDRLVSMVIDDPAWMLTYRSNGKLKEEVRGRHGTPVMVFDRPDGLIAFVKRYQKDAHEYALPVYVIMGRGIPYWFQTSKVPYDPDLKFWTNPDDADPRRLMALPEDTTLLEKFWPQLVWPFEKFAEYFYEYFDED